MLYICCRLIVSLEFMLKTNPQGGSAQKQGLWMAVKWRDRGPPDRFRAFILRPQRAPRLSSTSGHGEKVAIVNQVEGSCRTSWAGA